MSANSNYHILVIDDNEDILFMIKAMLEIKGYAVTVSDNILDIETKIKLVNPHLIIMDMLLSGADGREVCTQIKSAPLIFAIPIIMISALPAAANSCIAAGANYFLGKPFEMNDLYKTVALTLSEVNKNKLTAI